MGGAEWMRGRPPAKGLPLRGPVGDHNSLLRAKREGRSATWSPAGPLRRSPSAGGLDLPLLPAQALDLRAEPRDFTLRLRTSGTLRLGLGDCGALRFERGPLRFERGPLRLVRR